jgi:hypothetical protein
MNRNDIFLSTPINHKYPFFLFFMALSLVIIAGCVNSPETQEIQTPVTVAKTVMIHTTTPTVTTTPSRTSTSTHTETPTIAHPHTPTPQFTSTPVPLSQIGPWVIYSTSNDLPPSLCNLNGSGCIPVNMPDASWGWKLYDYIVSPAGGYLSLLAMESRYDPQIWIVKLPEQTIIRKIPLLAQKVRETLPEKLDPNYPSFYYSLDDRQNVQWSPDGQFLAFVSAQDSTNSDLYLYNVNNDSIRKLSSENKSVSILGWSPGSNLLVYARVEDYDYDYPNEISIEVADIGNNALSPIFSSEIEDAYSGNVIAGWTSDVSFLIFRYIYEAAPRYLRLVNIASNQVKTLFTGPFITVEVDEITGAVFFVSDEYKGEIGTFEKGIFRLDIQTGFYWLTTPGEWYSTYWSTGLNTLVASREENDQWQTIFISSAGRKTKEYKGKLYPSPNGEWLLVSNNSGTVLFDNKDEIIKDFTGKNYQRVIWLKDSSGFLGVIDHDIYFHTMDSDWQGILVFNDFSDGEIIYP